MARDYYEERLRSGEEATTIRDKRLLKEGAYVCVPVETLERVREIIDGARRCSLSSEECVVEIENELFPEEGSK